ncbi:uncharacterized protein LOC113280351 [Papaver somniferum]|uniref:uncharacterized protein LOC113280351 n=1 Tax=Papaver somniferum TaxID=3469 RepID=UPI000E6FD7DE|nr:uncharacterized protein LOC113280351 [Papaver somniferum]
MGGEELSPIYYVSRCLRDAELRYPCMEQACLAFIYATQKLRPYLLKHETIVVAEANPIAYLASKPVLTGRTARWILQLSEFELKYQRPKAVRGKAIADLTTMFPGEGDDEVHEYLPGEVEVTDTDKSWNMFFDGNNVSEYEALILGLRMDKKLNLGSVEVKGDSNIVTNQVNGDFYVKEPHLASTLPGRGSKVDESNKALKQFMMILGELYYRAFGGSLAVYVNKREAEKLFQEFHTETCGTTDAVHLYRELQRFGVYWPSMSTQAASLQDSCVDCQSPPQPAEVCTAEGVD